MKEPGKQGHDILPVTPRSGIEELEALLADPMFEASYVSVRSILDPGGRSLATELVKLREDLALRREDPELLEAFDVWGRSPNAKGMKGPDEQGFNAGVVHYFEYRGASIAKARRFKTMPEMSIQGFIDFSRYVDLLISDPDSRSNLSIQKSAQIRDLEGQKRLLLLTWGNWLVVGFQKPGDRMRAITAGAQEKPDRFQKIVDEEVSGTPSEDHRVNRLGVGREIVDF